MSGTTDPEESGTPAEDTSSGKGSVEGPDRSPEGARFARALMAGVAAVTVLVGGVLWYTAESADPAEEATVAGPGRDTGEDDPVAPPSLPAAQGLGRDVPAGRLVVGPPPQPGTAGAPDDSLESPYRDVLSPEVSMLLRDCVDSEVELRTFGGPDRGDDGSREVPAARCTGVEGTAIEFHHVEFIHDRVWMESTQRDVRDLGVNRKIVNNSPDRRIVVAGHEDPHAYMFVDGRDLTVDFGVFEDPMHAESFARALNRSLDDALPLEDGREPGRPDAGER